MSEKIKIKPGNVGWIDAEELATYILGISDEAETDEIEEAIFEKFECSMDTFQAIVAHLLPMADSGVSPVTNEGYRGFSVPLDDEGHRMWVVKQKYGE